MQSRLIRFAFFGLAVLLAISVCLVDAGAQTRKKRRPRRVTKPAAARPVIKNPEIEAPNGEQNGDLKIVSTADETGSDQSELAPTSETKAASKKKPQPDQPENMQQTINTLSNQVDRLTDKLSQMQENDRALLDMERLTRAEQRAESLRSQLVDTEGKLADLQSRLEQIDYMLKPENIERATATYGTVHPEEARESRKRQLESEKTLKHRKQNAPPIAKSLSSKSVTSFKFQVSGFRLRWWFFSPNLTKCETIEVRNLKPET